MAAYSRPFKHFRVPSCTARLLESATCVWLGQLFWNNGGLCSFTNTKRGCRGEIVGLQWSDYDGKTIWVKRNICFGQRGEMSVELPKTEASEAPVPVIAPLRRILDAWKAKAEVTVQCITE